MIVYLTLSQTTNFRPFQIERVCRRQFYVWWKWQTVLQKGRKHSGKRRNCLLRAISPFPTVFSKDLYCRHVKTRDCLGKGKGLTLDFMIHDVWLYSSGYTLYKFLENSGYLNMSGLSFSDVFSSPPPNFQAVHCVYICWMTVLPLLTMLVIVSTPRKQLSHSCPLQMPTSLYPSGVCKIIGTCKYVSICEFVQQHNDILFFNSIKWNIQTTGQEYDVIG